MKRDYGKELKSLGLTELQVVTILTCWSCDSIEALLRGEIPPPSQERLGQALVTCEGY